MYDPVKKILNLIIALAVFGAIVSAGLYVLRVPLKSQLTDLQEHFFPCKNPITYKLGAFDTRFGITQKTFLADMQTAAQIWGAAAGRSLFVYDPNGVLTVNLVYDSRQEATTKLRALGLTVDESQSSYTTLNAKYQALIKTHTANVAALDAQVKDFNSQEQELNAEITTWNKRGGAPQQVYDSIQAQQKALQAAQATIQTKQTAVNTEVDTINAMVEVLNRLGATLNSQADTYNNVGKTLGGEFEEGDYETGPGVRAINIYQFDTSAKLIKLMAHELGHALGMGHDADPTSIMYHLNLGTNIVPTKDDLAELQQACPSLAITSSTSK